MPKFKNKDTFSKRGFKSDFIVACLQIPKSRYKEINWAKEMKMMNSLAKKCDNPDFWLHARTEFPIPSLAWFLTPSGRKYLNEKYATFTLSLKSQGCEAQKVYLEEAKQEEDLELKKKPKTLMDFLKNRK